MLSPFDYLRARHVAAPALPMLEYDGSAEAALGTAAFFEQFEQDMIFPIWSPGLLSDADAPPRKGTFNRSSFCGFITRFERHAIS